MTTTAIDRLFDALKSDRPAVLVLGQQYLGKKQSSRLLSAFLDRLGGKRTSGWRDAFSGDPVTESDFEWLTERFERVVLTPATEQVFDLAWSAVFTSSVDREISKRLLTRGRIPETILSSEHFARTARSRSRPAVHYLFGVTTETSKLLRPPTTALEFRQRSARHANPLLSRVFDSATPLGIVVVDGIDTEGDWLDLDSLLAHLSPRPGPTILLFGDYSNSKSEFLREMVDLGVVVRDDRTLAKAMAQAVIPQELEESILHVDPGTVHLGKDRFLRISPTLRLRVEGAAAVVDDSWTDDPAFKDASGLIEAFQRFHGDLGGPRLHVEGVLRGFSIVRDFETPLLSTIRSAVHRESSITCVVLHGQSGTGKSIALARLAVSLRNDLFLPVLFSWGRIPLPIEIDEFCEEAERAGAIKTIVICDGNHTHNRYLELVAGLKSRGRRAIVVGSSYLIEDVGNESDCRLIKASELLSKAEVSSLGTLLTEYSPHIDEAKLKDPGSHFLALLYRHISPSRKRLASGVAREARATESRIRSRAMNVPKPVTDSLLAVKLREAGLASEDLILFESNEDLASTGADTAARLIDLVMVAGRLDCAVPVNLLLRALRNEDEEFDATQIAHVFGELDIFRWRFGDAEKNAFLIQPRLQLEAELICRMRVGDVARELDCLIDLLLAVRRDTVDEQVEIQFAVGLLHKLHHDGPRGDAYNTGYLKVARALSELRCKHRVVDAGLMLQESTFRREAVFAAGRVGAIQALSEDERNQILEEARETVELALEMLAEGSLSAGKRQRQNFAVERASIYGYLAVEMVKNGKPESAVWPQYLAARNAIAQAASVTTNFYPLDIGIWAPRNILESANGLSRSHKAELQADIFSVIDQARADVLKPSDAQRLHARRIQIARSMGDTQLEEDAFKDLAVINMPLALYLRARTLAPSMFDYRLDASTSPSRSEALSALEFLGPHKAMLETDIRCLILLIQLRWVAETGGHIFRQERCRLPQSRPSQVDLLSLVAQLNQLAGDKARNVFRLLEATLEWLVGNGGRSKELFRELARDSDYEDPSRVLRRLLLVGEASRGFEGRAIRMKSEGHWEIAVTGFPSGVGLLQRDFPGEKIDRGREIQTTFHLAFNYLGPIADPLPRGRT